MPKRRRDAGTPASIDIKALAVAALLFVFSQIALYYGAEYVAEHVSVILARSLFVLSLCVWAAYGAWKLGPWILDRVAKGWTAGTEQRSRFARIAIAVVVTLTIAATSPLYAGKVVPDQQRASPEFDIPTFIDESQEVSFSFGQMVSYCTWGTLREQIMEPFDMNGVRPIQVYIQNDILYANVKLYSGDNTTPIEIDGRTFVVQPEGWEYNYDALAFEVVDDEKQPVFQFIRRTAFDVVVNGVLSVRGWVVAGNESGLIINPSPLQLAEFSLNPIFKYPSSKYQGQRRQVK